MFWGMRSFNHYSAPILVALLVGGGFFQVLRHGCKTRDLILLFGATVSITAAWFVLRPVSKTSASFPGKPCLLEIQSPYCLACVAAKPVVDRLEATSIGSLIVRRVDIQSDEGQKLAKEYDIEFTPTFVFLDAAGREQWRSVGRVDTARVRRSIH